METEKKWPVDLGTDGGQERVTSKKKYCLLKGRVGVGETREHRNFLCNEEHGKWRNH